eukprot:9488838-Pyramimonas_sp.AAC.1
MPSDGPLAPRAEIIRAPLRACWTGHDPRQIIPCGPLSRVGRARMSNTFQNLHRRHEGAVILVGVITIGAVTGCPV